MSQALIECIVLYCFKNNCLFQSVATSCCLDRLFAPFLLQVYSVADEVEPLKKPERVVHPNDCDFLFAQAATKGEC